MFLFSDTFGVVPKPKSGEREQNQTNGNTGGVKEFDFVVWRADIIIDDGTVVQFFDKVGCPVGNGKHLAGS